MSLTSLISSQVNVMSSRNSLVEDVIPEGSVPKLKKSLSELPREDQSKKAALHSPYISRVADYLYVGSIEASLSEPLLCRYRIDSLVDVSGVRAEQVPPSKKTWCPCTCPLQTAHQRAKLCITIHDEEDEDITPFCRDINVFIHSSRVNKRNVLVFSYHGHSRAPAIVAQYLVQMERMSLSASLQLLSSARPQLNINRGFLKTLRKIEKRSSRLSCRSNNQPAAKEVTEIPAKRETRFAWNLPRSDSTLKLGSIIKRTAWS